MQYEPSRFWRKLGDEHAADLRTHGYANLKRRQALRYFTWQWRVKQAGASEQLRFLLRASSPATIARSALLDPRSLAAARWAPLAWSPADRWLYTFAIRLLWSHARAHDRKGVLDLDEPELGNPPPVYLGGRLISQDLANSALELGAVPSASPRSILEIGAGYGRTAYALLSLHPEAAYTIVDIEPAISISRWYLTALFPQRKLRFVGPDELGELGRDFDLALSISSLQEMRPDQVAAYLALMDRVVDGVVYLKQWREWHNPTDDVTMRFADFPIPRRWRQRFLETCPVQTRFLQGAWDVRGGSR
jgi:putative sugar O-methyltransferase